MEEEEIISTLNKLGITEEKILKIREKILDSIIKNEKTSKINDKGKIRILKDYYGNGYEERFGEKLFKLHKKLLNSKDITIKFEALKEIERLKNDYESRKIIREEQISRYIEKHRK